MREIDERHRTIKWKPVEKEVKVYGLKNEYEYKAHEVDIICSACGKHTCLTEDIYIEHIPKRRANKYVYRDTDPRIEELEEHHMTWKPVNTHLYCSKKCKVAEHL